MTSFQKTIKYLAIAFGAFLTINIIGGIVFGLTMLFGVTMGIEKASDHWDSRSSQSAIQFSQEFRDITDLKIDLGQAKITILEGDTLKVQASNISNNFSAKMNGTTLMVKDKSYRWRHSQDNSEVTIYLPKGTSFNSVELDTGISDTYIQMLETDRLELDLGAGNVKMDTLLVKKNTIIDAGVGKTEITNGKLNNVKLNMGVGEFILAGKLLGKSSIDCGVGKLELKIVGNKEEYTIRTDTGLGPILIDGQASSDHGSYGLGENIIDVDGGVGAAYLEFESEVTAPITKTEKEDQINSININQNGMNTVI